MKPSPGATRSPALALALWAYGGGKDLRLDIGAAEEPPPASRGRSGWGLRSRGDDARLEGRAHRPATRHQFPADVATGVLGRLVRRATVTVPAAHVSVVSATSVGIEVGALVRTGVLVKSPVGERKRTMIQQPTLARTDAERLRGADRPRESTHEAQEPA